MLENALVGIITGIVASFIFTFFIVRWIFITKLEISRYISKVNRGDHYDYFFKIVNLSNEALLDVKIYCTLFSPVVRSEFTMLQTSDVLMGQDSIPYFPKKTKYDEYNMHAIRIRTKENLEDLLRIESSYLLFVVSVMNGNTGLRKVFHIHYTKKNIVEKKFRYGDDLGVE